MEQPGQAANKAPLLKQKNRLSTRKSRLADSVQRHDLPNGYPKKSGKSVRRR